MGNSQDKKDHGRYSMTQNWQHIRQDTYRNKYTGLYINQTRIQVSEKVVDAQMKLYSRRIQQHNQNVAKVVYYRKQSKDCENCKTRIFLSIYSEKLVQIKPPVEKCLCLGIIKGFIFLAQNYGYFRVDSNMLWRSYEEPKDNRQQNAIVQPKDVRVWLNPTVWINDSQRCTQNQMISDITNLLTRNKFKCPLASCLISKIFLQNQNSLRQFQKRIVQVHQKNSQLGLQSTQKSRISFNNQFSIQKIQRKPSKSFNYFQKTGSANLRNLQTNSYISNQKSSIHSSCIISQNKHIIKQRRVSAQQIYPQYIRTKLNQNSIVNSRIIFNPQTNCSFQVQQHLRPIQTILLEKKGQNQFIPVYKNTACQKRVSMGCFTTVPQLVPSSVIKLHQKQEGCIIREQDQSNMQQSGKKQSNQGKQNIKSVTKQLASFVNKPKLLEKSNKNAEKQIKNKQIPVQISNITKQTSKSKESFSGQIKKELQLNQKNQQISQQPQINKKGQQRKTPKFVDNLYTKNELQQKLAQYLQAKQSEVSKKLNEWTIKQQLIENSPLASNNKKQSSSMQNNSRWTELADGDKSLEKGIKQRLNIQSLQSPCKQEQQMRQYFNSCAQGYKQKVQQSVASSLERKSNNSQLIVSQSIQQNSSLKRMAPLNQKRENQKMPEKTKHVIEKCLKISHQRQEPLRRSDQPYLLKIEQQKGIDRYGSQGQQVKDKFDQFQRRQKYNREFLEFLSSQDQEKATNSQADSKEQYLNRLYSQYDQQDQADINILNKDSIEKQLIRNTGSRQNIFRLSSNQDYSIKDKIEYKKKRFAGLKAQAKKLLFC